MESLQAAGLPAALYAIQGILQYTAYLHLDAVTYNGLSQTKVFSSALACAVLLGQIPTSRQCVALCLLVVSTLMFQGTWAWMQQPPSSSPDGMAKQQQGVASATTTTTTTRSPSLPKTSTWWCKGVLPCLGATLLSGVAGALSQKGLQQQAQSGGGGGRNAYLYTLEVSLYSAISAFILSLLRRFVPSQSSSNAKHNDNQQTSSGVAKPRGGSGTTTDDDAALFRHWTWWTLLPVTCKAMGGVLTALVHKHAGSVSKGFALTLGLVMSTGINDQELQLHQGIATILVMLSSWLHFSIPNKST